MVDSSVVEEDIDLVDGDAVSMLDLLEFGLAVRHCHKAVARFEEDVHVVYHLHSDFVVDGAA